MQGPRNVAGPVVRGGDLWGRDGEIGLIKSMLERGSVLLTGPRRHGKSSLMYAVHDAPPPDTVVMLIDLEWVETPDEFLTTLAAELLATDRVRALFRAVKAAPRKLSSWVAGAIDEVGLGAGNLGELKIRLRGALPIDEDWSELANQLLGLLRTLPGKTILILDEFPIMVSSMIDRDPDTATRFLKWFRAFRQSPGTENLTFLLGGSTNIEPRLEELGAEALIGDLQRLRISPFPPEKAVDFVEAVLAQEGLDCEGGVARAICEVSRSGVPFYLQVIVAECIAHHRSSGSRITPDDVPLIYHERVLGPVNRQRFSHYHSRLKSYYGPSEELAKVVLQKLCAGPATVESLRAALAAAGLNQDAIGRVLVLLESDYYIVRDGPEVRFTDGLLADWWKRNAHPARGI